MPKRRRWSWRSGPRATPTAWMTPSGTNCVKYYDEGEIIELLAAIGLFNYFNRFNNALHMEPTK